MPAFDVIARAPAAELRKSAMVGMDAGCRHQLRNLEA